MEINEILSKLDELCTQTKEDLDKTSLYWAKLKSRHEHQKEIREIKLAQIKLNFEGSDASQTTQAKAHPDWSIFVNRQIEETAEFYTADYIKKSQEQLVDILRSLLSFEKSRISQEV